MSLDAVAWVQRRLADVDSVAWVHTPSPEAPVFLRQEGDRKCIAADLVITSHLPDLFNVQTLSANKKSDRRPHLYDGDTQTPHRGSFVGLGRGGS